MSDFLSRLAARVTGELERSRPRVRSSVEEHAVEEEGTLEIVDEEAVAPAAPMPSGLREPASTSHARAAPVAVADSSPARAPDQGHRPHVDAPAAPAPPETAPAASPAVEADAPEAHLLDPPRTEIPRSPAREATPPPAAVPAMPTAPVVPVVRAARDPAGPVAAAVTNGDQPPVRVHIGRLEVRANLQEPVRESRPERRMAEELSLGDYLRGRREAR